MAIRKAKRVIAFDLILKEIKKEFGNGNYSKAYDELYQHFCINFNFFRIQGSVFCSKDLITDTRIIYIIKKYHLKRNG